VEGERERSSDSYLESETRDDATYEYHCVSEA